MKPLPRGSGSIASDDQAPFPPLRVKSLTSGESNPTSWALICWSAPFARSALPGTTMMVEREREDASAQGTYKRSNPYGKNDGPQFRSASRASRDPTPAKPYTASRRRSTKTEKSTFLTFSSASRTTRCSMSPDPLPCSPSSTAVTSRSCSWG